MNETIRKLMTELKSGLAQIYGDQLKGIYLYGSYARGKADAESDVDVLVILDQFDHYASEVDRTFSLKNLTELWCQHQSRLCLRAGLVRA